MIRQAALNKIREVDSYIYSLLPEYAFNFTHLEYDNKFVILYFGLRKRVYSMANRPKKPTEKFLNLLKERLKDRFYIGHTYQTIDYFWSTMKCKTIKIWVTNIYEHK